MDYDIITAPQQAIVQENAIDMYLAYDFLCQSDRKQYGRLLEELENNYTKGNSNYPTDLVTAYRMISEYKNWQPHSSVPESDGVAFAQVTIGKPKNVNQIEDWMKDKECYKCGQKVHISTVRPVKKSNRDPYDDDRSKNSPPKSFKRKNHSEKKKKNLNNSSKKTMKKMKSPTITDSLRLDSAL